jgi:hypothetical protein
MVCPSFWADYYMLIYTHCWELMDSVGSHGSSSLPFVMKVMVCHFVSDSHEVMTVLIVVLPLIVVVEISLQLHQASITCPCSFLSLQFFLLSFLWVLLVLSFSISFLDLASVMAESSAYFWSYDRNLIHWLVFDITGHPFLGTDAISANVMVSGHYHICCCQRSRNMWMTVTVLQITPQLSFVVLFYLSSRIVVALFHGC